MNVAHRHPVADDADLWVLLSARSSLGAAGAASAKLWWDRERVPGEGAVEFLARVEVLTGHAVRELALVRKGYLKPVSLDHLLAPGGADRLARVRPVAAETLAEDGPSDGTRPAELPPPALEGHVGPGATLGACTLIERVGEGANGVVFRARHERLGIPVAVKVLRLRSAAERERVRTEARLLARLNHPNVVRVWDFDEVAPAPYLVLEWVEGPSLEELIRRAGRLSAPQAVAVARQAASALAEAQRVGVVHRDVKPANILLTASRDVKLADLGTAAMAGRPAAMAGTCAYMAPEAFRGSPPDARSDQYSLGATLYQMLTGRVPFDGDSPLEVMTQHAERTPAPPDRLVPGLPPAASAATLKALSKDPADRFGSYAEFAAALTAPTGRGR